MAKLDVGCGNNPGDLVMNPPKHIRLQWKCPEWFLTAHKTVRREKPTNLTDAAEGQKMMVKRLRQLGYM